MSRKPGQTKSPSSSRRNQLTPKILRRIGYLAAELEPVVPVPGHVVAAERQHRHRVAPDRADRAGCGRGRLGAHRRAEVDAVGPVERLVDERHGVRAPPAEDERLDRDALRVLPLGIERRALGDRRGEARVRMSGAPPRARRPLLPLPVDELGRVLLRHAFPPDVPVRRERDVREDRVRGAARHRVRVRALGRSRRDAEEAGLGVDRVQPSVLPRA